MTVQTDIGFNPRGILARNGVIRAAHPDTYAKTANGLYVKYRRRIAGFMFEADNPFVPTGASWTQVNAEDGPDLSQFNTLGFLGQSNEGRLDSDSRYRLILHVLGKDVQFRSTFETNALVITNSAGSSVAWTKQEVQDNLAAAAPRYDNIYFECIDDGTSPELYGFLLEEAIMEVGDAP